MTYATWLADALRSAGLNVVEEPGWQTRGRGPMGKIAGVLCHHTAARNRANAPSLRLVRDGRPDLPGPLSQLLLARDGTFHVIAAGRCNHAGRGEWRGVSDGNSAFIGIEAENAGDGSEPWPEVQVDAYASGVAALLDNIGAPSDMAAGHKEYALPKGRKIDPSFDMAPFRARVRGHLKGKPAQRAVHATDPSRAMLRRGDSGDSVRELQALLRIVVDGQFGPLTHAAVKRFQEAHGLAADGMVGPATWKALLAVGPVP